MCYPTYICNDRVNLLVVYSFYIVNLSFFTGSSSAIYERGTNAFFLERASLSSLPFGIDDPPQGSKGNDISDLIVDLYQGGKTANLRKGSLLPKSVPLVASNFSIRTEARYIPYSIIRSIQEIPSTFVFHLFNLTGLQSFYLNTFPLSTEFPYLLIVTS